MSWKVQKVSKKLSHKSGLRCFCSLIFIFPCLYAPPGLAPLVGSSFSGWKRSREYLSFAVSCLEPKNKHERNHESNP